jgi:23S rRNA (cytosine1962-C5)-methyltransferase
MQPDAPELPDLAKSAVAGASPPTERPAAGAPPIETSGADEPPTEGSAAGAPPTVRSGAAALPTVRLTPRGLGRARTGHPWVYRGDLAELPRGLRGGETVAVSGPRSEFLGLAFYSSRSLIALRVFHPQPAEVDGPFWTRRLDEALSLRDDLFPGAQTVRLVYGESDGLPSLIVDRYGAYLVVQTLSQAAERMRDLWIEHLARRLSPAGVLARNDARVRALEGLPQEVEVLRGEVPEEVEVELEGVRLLADLRGGQKTGAFLDQRENYRAAARIARGRVLDAFSYQGGFALHAAPRAERVEAVEISPAAVRRGQENARRNGLANVVFVEANAFDHLHAADARGERYDTVILDPPAFAKSRKALEPGLRGYKEVNLRALRILSRGGILVTCSCSYHVTEELFLDVLRSAAHDAGRTCQILERRGQSRDHPVLATCPETSYLKCVIARVL